MELLETEIDGETEKWKAARILYVIATTPAIVSIERLIRSKWDLTTKPNVYYHSDEYFFIKCSCLEYRNDIVFIGQ